MYADIIKDSFKQKLLAKKVFSLLDSDNKGFLSISDLEEIMILMSKKLEMALPTQELVELIFQRMHKNNSSIIKLDEFEKLMIEIIKIMYSFSFCSYILIFFCCVDKNHIYQKFIKSDYKILLIFFSLQNFFFFLNFF